jgi:CRISPR-associated protein Csm2
MDKQFRIDDFKANWITQGIDDKTVEFAEIFGFYLCNAFYDERDKQWKSGKNAMTTSQIRNIYGEIKRIQAKGYDKEKSSFLLLRPKLAYAEARVTAKEKESRIKAFRSVMERAHQYVINTENFDNFVNLFEATLAYHKFYGGKDMGKN